MRAKTTLLLLALFAWALPLHAADRPGSPDQPRTYTCGNELLQPPAVCVQFRNTAKSAVGFMLAWTENGQAMSTDLRTRAECLNPRFLNEDSSCEALQKWFSGQTDFKQADRLANLIGPYHGKKFINPSDAVQAFRLTNLSYDSEYCFSFRAVDIYGMWSKYATPFTCARTPADPGRPRAIAAPQVTPIPPVEARGSVGNGKPYQVLVEWDASSQERTVVGFYVIEIWNNSAWFQGSPKIDVMREIREFVVDLPSNSPDDRLAFRVCAANVLHKACSPESWIYGKHVVGPSVAAVRKDPAITPSRLSSTTSTGRGALLSAAINQPTRTAPTPAGAAILYGVGGDGVMRWYRHDGAAVGAGERDPGSWAIPKNVSRGWTGFKQIIAGGSGVIYGLAADGKLIWYRHAAYLDGRGGEVAGAWSQPQEVASGWDQYRTVFAGGDGVLYAVTADGQLLWFKHLGFADGANQWQGPTVVAEGWGDYVHFFSGGHGVIYATTPDGILKWQKHLGYLTGSAEWSAPQDVGRGWQQMRQVFSAGGGIIYAISQDGVLHWYKHNTYLSGGGLDKPDAWRPRAEVGHGWNSFGTVFAQF